MRTIEAELANRHSLEHERLQAKLAARPPNRQACNPQLLELRAIEARLSAAEKRTNLSKEEQEQARESARQMRARMAKLEAQEAERTCAPAPAASKPCQRCTARGTKCLCRPTLVLTARPAPPVPSPFPPPPPPHADARMFRRRQEREAATLIATRQLSSQQRAEDSAFALRVQGGRADHRAQRAHEFEQLVQRYTNVLAELEAQHRAEQVKVERAERLHAIRFGMTASKASQQATARPKNGALSADPPEGDDVGLGKASFVVTSTLIVQPSSS